MILINVRVQHLMKDLKKAKLVTIINVKTIEQHPTKIKKGKMQILDLSYSWVKVILKMMEIEIIQCFSLLKLFSRGWL